MDGSTGTFYSKFSLPNGLQKSDDPAAFLGSQYVASAVEVNLPLRIDPTI